MNIFLSLLLAYVKFNMCANYRGNCNNPNQINPNTANPNNPTNSPFQGPVNNNQPKNNTECIRDIVKSEVEKALMKDKKPDNTKNEKTEPDSPKETGCKNMGGKKVYLVADNGKMLARCYGCGPGTDKNSAGVHGKRGDGFAVWTLEDVGDKCAIKGDNGKYASRCNGCWRRGAYPDSVFVHVDKAGPSHSLWTLEKHGDSYAFKSDTGKYMARCNGCVPRGAKPDFAFIHASSPTGSALWKIEMV